MKRVLFLLLLSTPAIAMKAHERSLRIDNHKQKCTRKQKAALTRTNKSFNLYPAPTQAKPVNFCNKKTAPIIIISTFTVGWVVAAMVAHDLYCSQLSESQNYTCTRYFKNGCPSKQ